MAHPRHHLDSVIHSPVRFSIASALAAADQVQFHKLREILDTSSPTLSKHLSVLEEAGYVRVEKSLHGRRVRTHATLTESGREAFDAHCRTLSAIAEGAGSAPLATDAGRAD